MERKFDIRNKNGLFQVYIYSLSKEKWVRFKTATPIRQEGGFSIKYNNSIFVSFEDAFDFVEQIKNRHESNGFK